MSIRVRLLLLVLGTVLLPAMLVGGRYYQDRGKEIEAAIGGLAATARTIATSVDAKVQGTTQLHFGLSRARDLAAATRRRARNSSPRFSRRILILPAS